MNDDEHVPHPLVRLLGKPTDELTCDDLVEAVRRLGLRQVNLRYVGGDGRLKTLAFVPSSREHLVEVLTHGERVDGSSVFEGTATEDSDAYIVPRYRTAFVNPFGEEPSLDLLCSFYDRDGRPLAHAREQLVRRAAEALTAETGLVLEAFGELEYYLVGDPDPLHPVEAERGYQESPPFSKGQAVREQALHHLAAMGVEVKYGHGEVGNVLEAERQLVQHEIELRPVPVEQAADALVLAKWVVREVAHAHGLEVTFAPSIGVDGAGNGLHVHTRLVREGSNVLVDDDGALTETALRLVAGYLGAAPALTALGCTVPTSYLRFADGEESPELICWGETDRTGLVRVPLAWAGDVLAPMQEHANGDRRPDVPAVAPHPQTVELRLGDGSADVHLLLAGLAVAARRGLRALDGAAEAERLRADRVGEDAATLPSSVRRSAAALEDARAWFEEDGVFPPAVLDAVITRLRELGERVSMKKLAKDDKRRADLVREFWYVG
ncbi:glutamine synthetase beta-grasp domain-containing protein [Nocardioides litoris]|uniref:glutamine synthetase beta-grasp domain-containing protein n=1 Tax=Nocardioides litoris TaxID=1926648 RepID=UPI001122D5D6|nr:glutamine synthetase family protein [Nocardioides litoris]